MLTSVSQNGSVLKREPVIHQRRPRRRVIGLAHQKPPGKIPMEPSSTLIFTSISKQSISSPCSSALAKAMSAGLVVFKSCFILLK